MSKAIKTNLTDEEMELIYLDYVNNYVTVERMAESYHTSIDRLNYIIEKGRLFNNKRVSNNPLSKIEKLNRIKRLLCSVEMSIREKELTIPEETRLFDIMCSLEKLVNSVNK